MKNRDKIEFTCWSAVFICVLIACLFALHRVLSFKEEIGDQPVQQQVAKIMATSDKVGQATSLPLREPVYNITGQGDRMYVTVDSNGDVYVFDKDYMKLDGKSHVLFSITKQGLTYLSAKNNRLDVDSLNIKKFLKEQ